MAFFSLQMPVWNNEYWQAGYNFKDLRCYPTFQITEYLTAVFFTLVKTVI